MKNLNFLALIVLFFAFSFAANAQCNTELYTKQAQKQITDESYTFVKSYRIDGKNGARRKIEYTAVFSKDTNYNIRISGQDGDANNIIATLYDNQRIRLASNFHDGKFYKGWIYKCRATGIYYITFTFHKDAKSFCGAAVLGFRR